MKNVLAFVTICCLFAGFLAAEPLSLQKKQWKTVDLGKKDAPSKWIFSKDLIEQKSNIHHGNGSSTNPKQERYGTLAIYQGKKFADGTLTLEVNSSDDDSIGIAFCFQDERRHYLFTMDSQRKLRILALKNGSNYTVLGSDKEPYKKGKWYKVAITKKKGQITVKINGNEVLQATDKTFKSGTIALHSWANTGAKYRNINWSAK